MICLRCKSRMVRSHNDEREEVSADIVLITQVFIHECPSCTAMVKVILPVIPVELAHP